MKLPPPLPPYVIPKEAPEPYCHPGWLITWGAILIGVAWWI